MKNFFPELVLKKIKNLNERIELLTGHSTREKLIRYFSFLAKQNLNNTFKLDSSLTDLADYLNVDRSAMMRELSILKSEGFIEKSGNRITLLYK